MKINFFGEGGMSGNAQNDEWWNQLLKRKKREDTDREGESSAQEERKNCPENGQVPLFYNH